MQNQNSHNFTGRLVEDPRMATNGKLYFTAATNTSFEDDSEESGYKQFTTYHECVINNPNWAKAMVDKLKKGGMVSVTNKPTTVKKNVFYQDNDGNFKPTTVNTTLCVCENIDVHK